MSKQNGAAEGNWKVLRDNCLSEMIEKKQAAGLLDKMPYDQKIRIAQLLEVAADGTLTPDFIADMQAAKAQSGAQGGEPQPEQQPKAGRFSARPINAQKAASSYQTEGDRLAAGGTP